MKCEHMVHLIIDGYNVIRQDRTQSMLKADRDMGRSQFLKKLAQHYESKACEITVVFDGLYSDNRVVEEARWGFIRVVYSRFGQTADEYIVELAKSEGTRALVISSDQAILKAVKRFDCATLESTEFIQKINFESRLRLQGIKPMQDEPPERRIHTEKKGPRKKRPKAERRALNRLSKI